MKNYTDSDYALNKFSKGIVYKFADEIIEVTLEIYLSENPDKTVEDFVELKTLSDDIYLQQVRDENAQTKKNIPLSMVEESDAVTTPSLEDEYFDALDKENAPTFDDCLEILESCLTPIQRRRYLMFHFENKTEKEIAEIENTTQQAINKSIMAANKRLKKVLKNFYKKGC